MKSIKGEIEKIVNSYKRKHNFGFTNSEINDLIKICTKNYKISFNREKYRDAMNGITCMRDEKTKEFIIYPRDVINGITCGIENRNLNIFEWD